MAKFLFKALELTNDCDQAYRTSPNKRLLVELMLVKLCQITAPQDAIPTAVKPTLPQNVQTQPQQTPAQSKPASAQPQATSTFQPAAAQVQVQPQTTVNAATPKQSSRLPNFSISNLGTREKETSQNPQDEKKDTSEDNDDTHAQQAVQTNDQPVSEDRLAEVWKTLPNAVADNKRLMAAIQDSTPAIENGTTIVFTIRNNFLNSEVSENKTRIIKYLQDKLKNSQLTIRTEVKEIEAEHRAYTPTEMYQELLKENPVLEQLTNSFGLQLQ